MSNANQENPEKKYRLIQALYNYEIDQKTWSPGQNACKLLNNGQTMAAESIFTSTYLQTNLKSLSNIQ